MAALIIEEVQGRKYPRSKKEGTCRKEVEYTCLCLHRLEHIDYQHSKC